MAITKRFPGHGSFNEKISEYHPASDNYSITYQNGNIEVMSYSNVLKYVTGTKEYEDHHNNQLALYSAFHTAVSSTMTQFDNVPENYTDAWATPDVADWMKACDVGKGQTMIHRMLRGPTTIISPSKHISHEKSMDIHI